MEKEKKKNRDVKNLQLKLECLRINAYKIYIF